MRSSQPASPSGGASPARPRATARRREDRAVSTIVGTLLAVAGLVAVSGVLAVNLLQDPTDPLNARVEPFTNDSAVHIWHKGGEAIPTSTTRLYVVADGTET
ncbi:MAG: type IV pilin N-terminal domain-containing protein, partial [Candidatus Thermoplasmatota archaeon]|nr:type IV pilin N-terminal domain-containing protein [Candidatus Thermoplasmatota archaeon]